MVDFFFTMYFLSAIVKLFVKIIRGIIKLDLWLFNKAIGNFKSLKKTADKPRQISKSKQIKDKKGKKVQRKTTSNIYDIRTRKPIG